MCVQVHANRQSLAPLSPSCHCRSPTGDKPWYLHRGKLLLSTSQPSTLGNQRGGVNSYHQKKFLAPLPGTPHFKIGELHTIFYLCFFLVLLVYLSVFSLVSYMKNHKSSCYLLPLSCFA